MRKRVKTKRAGRQYELVHKPIRGILNERFVCQREDFPFCGFPEPWIKRETKMRYLRFEIFFDHHLPDNEEEEERIDPSVDTGQSRHASSDSNEDELLGMALADLLMDSIAGAAPVNLGDSATISMIGDKPPADYSSLIVDAAEKGTIGSFEPNN